MSVIGCGAELTFSLHRVKYFSSESAKSTRC